MGSSEYLWAPGETPPTIQDHSLAKHQVLARYLRVYIEVLTANVAMDSFRIALVDGFAGGGVYQTIRGDLHHGSPLQMLHAMVDAEIDANERRNKQFHLDVNFFFVERSPRNIEVLKKTLEHHAAAQRYLREERLHILQGTFESYAKTIAQKIAGRSSKSRAIFLLDQYGYSHVPLRSLRTILKKLPKAEILLTFATDWLIDYLSNKGSLTPERLRELGLSGFANHFDQLLSLKDQRDPQWRRFVQAVLHRDLVEKSGAKYFTPFFIVSPRAHREYWFVHLSNHARARDEMAKLHWAIENRFAHYGRHGLGMLGYDPRHDNQVTQQQGFDFSPDAGVSLKERLMEEIPSRLAYDKIPFDRFFDEICNETPATSTQIAETLRALTREQIVEVYSPHGKLRRPNVQIQASDQIKLRSQLRLDLGR